MSLQGQLTLSAGVTDNVTGAPNVTLPGARGRQTDLVLNVSPGIVLTAGTARAMQQLSYVLSGIVYARNSDASTYTNTLAWNGFFLPSKTTTMGLSLGLTQGRQSAFNTSLASASSTAQVSLSGATNILTIYANQLLSWDMTAHFRLVQTLGFSTSYFLDQSPPLSQTEAVPVRLGVERAWARDLLGIDANLVWSRFLPQIAPVVTANGSVDPNGQIPPQQDQLIATPLLRYRRDFTYFFSGRLEAGAAVVLDPRAVSNHHVEPAGGAGINFNHRLITVDISYSHGIAPNLLFHSSFINDLASIRANILFGERSKFALSLGASYMYSRQLDLLAVVDAHAHSVVADATLSYTPIRILSFFLRYQLVDQIGYETDAVPLPSFYRNTLLFGVSAIYPGQSAGAVPNALGVRADRRDDGQIRTSNSTNPGGP